MKKQSMFLSSATKVLHEVKINAKLTEFLDDPSSLNQETLVINPQLEWLVPSSKTVNSLDDIYDVVCGANFEGKVNYYTMPLGVFTTKEQISLGAIPVNFKMIGSNNELVINTSDTIYSIGVYTPFYSYYYTKELMWSCGVGQPQLDTSQRYGNWDGNTEYESNATISDLHQFSTTDMIELLNSSNPSPSKNKPGLFVTLCWSNQDGSPISLVSYTPIYLAFSKIEESIDLSVTIVEKTGQNKGTVDIFHVVPTSKIWVLKDHIYVDKGDNSYSLSSNYRKKDGPLGPVVWKNVRRTFTSSYLTTRNDSVTGVPSEIVYVKPFKNNYTVLGNFILDEDLTYDMAKSYWDQSIAANNVSLWSDRGGFFKLSSGKSPYMLLDHSLKNKFDRILKYTTFQYDELEFIIIPKWTAVFGTASNDSTPEQITTEYLPMCARISDNYYYYKNGSIFYSTYSERLQQLTFDKFLQTINQNSFILVSKDTNWDYRVQYDVDSSSAKFKYLINSKVTNQPSPIFASSILAEYESLVNVPFVRKVDTYKKYTFDRLYDVDEAPVTKTFNISNSHYSAIRQFNDDIILSADVDDLLDLPSIPDDYFTATILKSSKDKLDAFNNIAQNQPNPSEIVDKFVDKIKEKNVFPPESQITLTSDGQAKPLTDVQIHNIKEQIADTIKKEANETNLKEVLDDDQFAQYSMFKRYIVAFTQDEPKTAVIGHLRILNTNIKESPLYQGIEQECGITSDKISLYSEMFLEEYANILKTDPKALIDSIDITNEVNMINSIVASQTKELENGFNEVKKFLDDKASDGKDSLKTIHDKISSIFSSASQMSTNIISSANQYIEKANEMKNEFPNSYDTLLFNRNVTNVTGYLTSFTKALISDPYNALKQHAAYLRDRLNKASIKISIIEGILKTMEFIPSIPNLVIDGIGNAGLLIGKIALFALSTAMDAITIIDNVDKLVFISEQFLSRGIEAYSTIPTVYDDMFTPPEIGASRYDHIRRKAQVEIAKDVSFSKLVQEELIKTKDNPIIIEGAEYSYNDYPLDKIISGISGYYYPNKDNVGYPIIKPNGSTTLLLPDLTDFSPVYPQRGSLWKEFIKQLNVNNEEEIAKAESLTTFIPITEEIIATYGAITVGAGLIAAGGAVLSAGLRGDVIGMMVGGAIAAAAVVGANVKEIVTISLKRGLINDPNNVYTHFYLNYNNYVNQWQAIIDNDLLDQKYIFVQTSDDIPLFSDASDFKKYFLKVKEILILTTQLVGIGAVGFMIGRIANKIRTKIQAKRQRKGLKARNKREQIALKGQADARQKELEDKRQQIENDSTITDKEKKEMLKEVNKEEKNLKAWLKGELALSPTNKAGLNRILSANWGVSPLAASSSAKVVSSLSNLGPLTSKVMEDFDSQVKKFESTTVGKEVAETDTEINQDDTSVTNLLESTLGAGSNLLKMLGDIKTNTEETKKYV